MATNGDESEVVRKFLADNEVEVDWRNFIQGNKEICSELKNSLNQLEMRFKEHTPDRSKVFAAFKYCPLKKLKVIIIGHDPIPDQTLSTGLAFSFPEYTSEGSLKQFTGTSVKNVHTAIRSALELVGRKDEIPSQENTSCCHEDWARNGVLLLNSVLTISTGEWPKRREHKQIWIKFTKVLLKELLKTHKEKIVLFWGTNATEDIFKYLIITLQKQDHSIKVNKNKIKLTYKGENEEYSGKLRFFLGHHPTYPRGNENRFHQQASRVFRYIMLKIPVLFTLQTIRQHESHDEMEQEDYDLEEQYYQRRTPSPDIPWSDNEPDPEYEEQYYEQYYQCEPPSPDIPWSDNEPSPEYEEQYYEQYYQRRTPSPDIPWSDNEPSPEYDYDLEEQYYQCRTPSPDIPWSDNEPDPEYDYDLEEQYYQCRTPSPDIPWSDNEPGPEYDYDLEEQYYQCRTPSPDIPWSDNEPGPEYDYDLEEQYYQCEPPSPDMPWSEDEPEHDYDLEEQYYQIQPSSPD